MTPAQAANGTVSGAVIEAGTGTPIQGVTVRAFCWQVSGIAPGQLCGETLTALSGTYTLSLAPGIYKVSYDDWPNHGRQFYGGGSDIGDVDSSEIHVPSGGSVTGINASLKPLRSVTGTVTGAGSPIGGINVTAYQLSDNPVPSWESVEGVLTDPDGTFALHLPDGTYRVGFADANGPYQAEFYDDAGTVEAATDVVVAGAGVGGIDADLALNYPITGVVTVDGIDMPGVTVTAWQQVPDGQGSTLWEAVKFTTTGPDGRYALYLPDGTYRVEFRTFQGIFPTVYYDGASSLEAADDVTVAGAEVPDINATIVNEDPGSGPAITGTVTVEGSGEPAADVFVTAYRFNVLASAWLPVRSAQTAADGAYAVHVPEGPYRIGFSHPINRYQPTFYDGSATLDEAAEIIVPSEGVPNIDAQLVENRSISGRITADPVEGFPGPPPTGVEALRLNPDSSEWEEVSFGFGGPDGDYQVYVPDGTYRFRFMPFFELFEPVYYDGVDNIGEATDIPVAGADVPGIDVHLVAGSLEPPPPWPKASTLSATGQDAWGPDVAVAPDGGATAVWFRRDGSHARVQAATRPPGGDWRSPVTLSTPGGDAVDPQVSVGRKGAAVAVWRRWDGVRYRVQATARAAGGSWSTPVALSGTGGDAWDPRVAMSESGAAVAVWRQSEGSNSKIYAASLTGGRWSAPVALSSGDSWDARVVMAADGSAVAAWSRFDGAHYRVQVASRTAGGRWSAPAALSPPGADAGDPQVAAGASGAAAVWRQWDVGYERIMASTRPVGAAWSSAEAVSPEAQNAHEPDVALHPDGTATAVWARWDGGNERVLTASRTPSGAWSTPTKLSRAGEDAEWPEIVAGADGRETAVWVQSNGFSEQPVAAIRMPGGTWTPPASVSQFSPRASGPAVAAGSDGTVAVVWERRAGAEDRVQGVVRFDPPGAHCSNRFGVDLNVLFGVPEQFVDGPCRRVTEGSAWRPLTIWITNFGFDTAPPGFVPAGSTPVEDLAAKLASVRVVIDEGTDRERIRVFTPDEALRIDRDFSEYNPFDVDFPMGVSIPKLRALPAGEHTVRVIWRLSAMHCDGFTDVEEFSCLPSGDTSFGTRRFTVVSQ